MTEKKVHPKITEEQEVKVVHSYKDSIFVDLFCRYKDAKAKYVMKIT